MVLYRPEVQAACLVGRCDLGHELFVARLLEAVIVGFGYLNFIHEPEFHGHVLPQAGVGVNERSYPSPLSGRGTCAPAYPDLLVARPLTAAAGPCLPMTAVAKLLVYPRCRWMNVVIFSSACRATDEERLCSNPSPSPPKTVTSIWPPAFRSWRPNSSRSGRGCASSYGRARRKTGGGAVRSPRAKRPAGAPQAMASPVRPPPPS